MTRVSIVLALVPAAIAAGGVDFWKSEAPRPRGPPLE
jgi:hypothetical protein